MERILLKVLQPNQAEIISQGINDYIRVNGPEMLPKTPEQIMDQFNTRQSIVLAESGNVLFHATNYECLSELQRSRLDGIQVVEMGSWIAMVRGQRIGVAGAIELHKLGAQIWGEDTLFLATHKRMNALNISLNDLKFENVHYKDFPYLAYLTCTCENCSETYTDSHGYVSCPFRRSIEDVVEKEMGKIDCTLVISSLELAIKFEERCRELQMNMSGIALEPGEEITTERMLMAKELFDRIG